MTSSHSSRTQTQLIYSLTITLSTTAKTNINKCPFWVRGGVYKYSKKSPPSLMQQHTRIVLVVGGKLNIFHVEEPKGGYLGYWEGRGGAGVSGGVRGAGEEQHPLQPSQFPTAEPHMSDSVCTAASVLGGASVKIGVDRPTVPFARPATAIQGHHNRRQNPLQRPRNRCTRKSGPVGSEAGWGDIESGVGGPRKGEGTAEGGERAAAGGQWWQDEHHDVSIHVQAVLHVGGMARGLLAPVLGKGSVSDGIEDKEKVKDGLTNTAPIGPWTEPPWVSATMAQRPWSGGDAMYQVTVHFPVDDVGCVVMSEASPSLKRPLKDCVAVGEAVTTGHRRRWNRCGGVARKVPYRGDLNKKSVS